jgi:hypothetical protein
MYIANPVQWLYLNFSYQNSKIYPKKILPFTQKYLNQISGSDNSILVCQNLQFSSTKWAKAYLINYINIG